LFLASARRLASGAKATRERRPADHPKPIHQRHG